MYLDVCKLLNKKNEKKYAVFAWINLSKWIESKLLWQAKIANIAQFLYKNVICRYEYFQKLICDEKFKNKKVIQILAEYYKIKWIVISSYHSEVNELIKSSYKPVINALSKFADNDENWKSHFHSVLMIDYVFV